MAYEQYSESDVKPKRTAKKRTRSVKAEIGEQRVIKDKFMEERKQVPPLRPLNDLQADYIHSICTKPLTIATGLPGTSKTYIPTVLACDKYRLGEVDKIYLTRPNISSSKSLGYFSGSIVDKMSSWLLPVLSVMYDRLTRPVVEIAIGNGAISFVPLETIKGMSFGKNTYVIVDEAEDLTVAEAKSIVTRQGGCTMILAGDIEQSALDEKSGLRWLRDMVMKNPNLEETTGFVDFNRPSDIVRSDACKQWILAMRRDV